MAPLTHVTLGWTIPWDRLRVLDINGQGVGDEGVRSIVAGLGRRPGFAPLRWLGLANNGLKGDAIRALLHSDESRLKLYHLDVRNKRCIGERPGADDQRDRGENRGRADRDMPGRDVRAPARAKASREWRCHGPGLTRDTGR